MSLAFQLQVVLMKEGNIFVAYMPSLDLTTHGSSMEDALQAAVEAAQAFFEEIERMGTMDHVLKGLGWRKRSKAKSRRSKKGTISEFPYIPPEIIGTLQQSVDIRVSSRAA